MKELVRGQKVKLSSVTASSVVQVRVSARYKTSVNLRVACFGFDADGPVGAPYILSTTNRKSPCSAVVLSEIQNDSCLFEVNLARLPRFITRLRFVFGTRENRSFDELAVCAATLLADGGKLEFSLSGTNFENEKAVVLVELYFKAEWRFGAVGQGFMGGLTALLREWGLSAHAEIVLPEDDSTAAERVRRKKRRPSQQEAQRPLLLEDRGHRHFLDLERLAGLKPPRLTFVCRDVSHGSSFADVAGSLKRAHPQLGCMYVLEDGSRGAVQSLGRVYGNKFQSPFIYVEDGGGAENEVLAFYRPELVKLVMVYLYLFDETRDFESVETEVVVRYCEEEIVIPLRALEPQGFCSVCLIGRDGGYLALLKDERYFNDHFSADRHYGFGFSWE